MLRSLLIQNVALIDRLTLEFGSGLVVFTGETGAGKSVLLEAFALVLGQRAETSIIRHGQEAARVEALFDVGGQREVQDYLSASGLPVEEELVVVRELSREAKNRCLVNGSLTTRRVLEGLGDLLVDLHGQHDHQLLLRSSTHLKLVDDFGDRSHHEQVVRLRQRIAEFRTVDRELAEAEDASRGREIERDHLSYQVAEIDEVELGPGEDVRLQDELRTLAAAEGLREAVAQALACLEGDDEAPGALAGLERATGELERLARTSTRLDELAARGLELSGLGRDLRDDLVRYVEGISLDPDRMRQVEDRLARIHRLTKKYGRTSVEVLARREELGKRLEEIRGETHAAEGLERRRSELVVELESLAPKVSATRDRLAAALGSQIQEHLADLSMPEAQVEVRLVREEAGEGLRTPAGTFHLWADGLEKAEILVSTNPGEPPGTLAAIASGGEISRVMLGLKAAMAKLDMVPIMVFDEIDAGVGGRTGLKIAEKLRAVSRRCQCLCVTHLPALAAAGDHQMLVEKTVEAGRARVSVREVRGEERERELARMLAGDTGPESLGLARDLLAGGGARDPGAEARRPRTRPTRSGRKSR